MPTLVSLKPTFYTYSRFFNLNSVAERLSLQLTDVRVSWCCVCGRKWLRSRPFSLLVRSVRECTPAAWHCTLHSRPVHQKSEYWAQYCTLPTECYTERFITLCIRRYENVINAYITRKISTYSYEYTYSHVYL